MLGCAVKNRSRSTTCKCPQALSLNEAILDDSIGSEYNRSDGASTARLSAIGAVQQRAAKEEPLRSLSFFAATASAMTGRGRNGDGDLEDRVAALSAIRWPRIVLESQDTYLAFLRGEGASAHTLRAQAPGPLLFALDCLGRVHDPTRTAALRARVGCAHRALACFLSRTICSRSSSLSPSSTSSLR